MTDEPEEELTQRTPTGSERERLLRLPPDEEGDLEIPVPTRERVLGAFEKVAKAPKPPAAESDASERESGPEE